MVGSSVDTFSAMIGASPSKSTPSSGRMFCIPPVTISRLGHRDSWPLETVVCSGETESEQEFDTTHADRQSTDSEFQHWVEKERERERERERGRESRTKPGRV